MYGKQHLSEQPELQEYLSLSMSKLSNKVVRQTDRFVIVEATDAHHLLQELTVPALALKGKEDYVPISDAIPYTKVEGGHVSPLEVPKAVFEMIQKVRDL
ncbi:MAG: hypothetical protein AAGI23_17790 [Bacteroidota bacterium]